MPGVAESDVKQKAARRAKKKKAAPEKKSALVIPADVATEMLKEATAWSGNRIYYHSNYGQMLASIIDTHQEQLRSWSGVFLHHPCLIEHTGLTAADRRAMQNHVGWMRSRINEQRVYNNQGQIFHQYFAVYDSFGRTLAEHLEDLFYDRLGESLFSNAGPRIAGRKRELTIQLGVWLSKLPAHDRIRVVRRQLAFDYGSRQSDITDDEIQARLATCVYARNNGRWCTCRFCTERAEYSTERLAVSWREGQPVNRIFVNGYRKAKVFNEQFISDLNNRMALMGEIWSGRKRKLRVTVSCHPASFMKLGHGDATKGDGSCYRNGGEWGAAKHLLTMLPHSCTFYFYREEDWREGLGPYEEQDMQPVARAWGFWVPEKLIACSNFYGLPARELRAGMDALAKSELGENFDGEVANERARLLFQPMHRQYAYVNSDGVVYCTDNEWFTTFAMHLKETLHKTPPVPEIQKATRHGTTRPPLSRVRCVNVGDIGTGWGIQFHHVPVDAAEAAEPPDYAQMQGVVQQDDEPV